jgi:hypothetical protein
MKKPFGMLYDARQELITSTTDAWGLVQHQRMKLVPVWREADCLRHRDTVDLQSAGRAVELVRTGARQGVVGGFFISHCGPACLHHNVAARVG